MPTAAPDIYSMFASPDDHTAEEQARALSAALRGKHDLGELAVLSGDPVLTRLGTSQLDDASAGQHLLATAGGSRLTKLIQQRQMEREQANKDRELAQGDRRIGIEASRANQDNDVPIQTGSGVFLLNKRTGSTQQMLGADGSPVAAKGAAGGGLNPKATEDGFNKLADAISTYRGRGNLNRENQERLQSAERLEKLVVGENGDILNLTPQQVREASTSLANLIAKGAMSEGQINELTPSTLAGQFANVKQKLFNEPQGADAQAFLKNMIETAQREKKLVMQQLRQGQLQGIAPHANLRKIDKARFDSTLKAAGIDPSTIDDNGLPVQASAPTPAAALGPPPAGTAWVQAPTGKIKAIPLAQLQAAITIGGGKQVQ